MDRRTFAQTAGAVMLAGGDVLGANERTRFGVIGCGGRGRQVLRTFIQQPEVETVAVCDVYEPFLREGAQLAGAKAGQYKDFRKLLERKDIDAVLIATPDHWHALMTVMACEAGKDVYVEKPLSLTLREGRAMVDAARRHKRVVQTGTQQRSGAHYAKAVKLIRDGAIGKVSKITAGHVRNIGTGFTARALQNGLTPDLDWDMWLGPAPKVPFDPFRCIYHFRWFWDYSGGQMTNWGAHDLDIARWAVGAAGPSGVAAFGGRYAVKDGDETPDVQEVLYSFPDCLVTWTTREMNSSRKGGLEFHGTRGSLSLGRGGFEIKPETIENNPLCQAIAEKGGNLDAQHVRNFLDCVKTRQKPNADVEEGHRTASMCHLGNIATRLGRSIRWDAEKEEIIGDAEASKWLSKPYTKPWKLA